MYTNNLNRSNTRSSNRSNNSRISPPSPTLSRASTAVGSVVQAKKLERGYVFHCIPAHVGLGIFIPLLFFFAIFMIVAGGLIAVRLLHQAHKLSRLAIILQLANYSIVIVIAALGMYAMIRRSLRASQFFTGLLIGQLPFGIVAGAISMRVIFRAASNTAQNAALSVASAAASSNAASAVAVRAVETETGSWEETCSAALHGLTFICKRWHRVQPLIVVAYLLFWFLEMIIIYAGIVYIRQLLSKEVKILEDDDA